MPRHRDRALSTREVEAEGAVIAEESGTDSPTVVRGAIPARSIFRSCYMCPGQRGPDAHGVPAARVAGRWPSSRDQLGADLRMLRLMTLMMVHDDVRLTHCLMNCGGCGIPGWLV